MSKKKLVKNVGRDNEFLKDYAVKCNGLLLYTESNEQLTKEIKLLQDDFQFTVPSHDPHAKRLEKNIKQDFEELMNLFQQADYNEEQAMLLVKGIRRYIIEISSLQ